MSQRNYRSFPRLAWLAAAIVMTALGLSGWSAEKDAPVMRASTVETGNRISGPLLGYLPGGEQQGVRGIWGIPGAAMLGATEQPGLGLKQVWASPAGYLMGLPGDNGEMSVYTRSGDGWAEKALAAAGTPVGAVDGVVYSPSGSAVALLDVGARTVRVFRGLPETPQLSFAVPVAAAWGGHVEVAVSDDGELAALAAIQNGESTLYVASREGQARAVGQFGVISSLEFMPQRAGLLAAELNAGRVVYFPNLAESMAWAPLLTSSDGLRAPVSVAGSRDGKQVVVLSEDPATVLNINLETRQVTATSAAGNAQRLWRMHGNSVFLLTSDVRQPLRVYDGDVAQPRVVYVPADPAPVRSGQAERDPRPGSPRGR